MGLLHNSVAYATPKLLSFLNCLSFQAVNT
nr:MAG TPA: hypothetical protein [Caudoviricetes sp.]DAW20050.1 MAG TPA: hypothetical protein [Caudoviricetes sp.]